MVWARSGGGSGKLGYVLRVRSERVGALRAGFVRETGGGELVLEMVSAVTGASVIRTRLSLPPLHTILDLAFGVGGGCGVVSGSAMS